MSRIQNGLMLNDAGNILVRNAPYNAYTAGELTNIPVGSVIKVNPLFTAEHVDICNSGEDSLKVVFHLEGRTADKEPPITIHSDGCFSADVLFTELQLSAVNSVGACDYVILGSQ